MGYDGRDGLRVRKQDEARGFDTIQIYSVSRDVIDDDRWKGFPSSTSEDYDLFIPRRSNARGNLSLIARNFE